MQRLQPLPMSEAYKCSGQPAAGAGKACDIVKWAEGWQVCDTAVTPRQGQKKAGSEDAGQGSPERPGTDLSRRFVHGWGGRGCRGVCGFSGGGGQEDGDAEGGGPVMAAFQMRFNKSCCKTGLIIPKLVNPPKPTRSRIRYSVELSVAGRPTRPHISADLFPIR